MALSVKNKDRIRRALTSILIGAIISLITEVIQVFIAILRSELLDLASPLTGMIYYLKSRRVA